MDDRLDGQDEKEASGPLRSPSCFHAISASQAEAAAAK